MEQGSKKRKVIGFIEGCAIPSFKHVALHVSVAIVLFALFTVFLYGIANIESASFVSITSSISTAAGALLAVSIALSVFLTSHVTSWRDKLIDRLEKGRTKLENQMAKSAKSFPEISQRLSWIYEKAAFYVTGQPINAEDVFNASKIYDDWAKEKALKSQKDGKTFNFGDLGTYETFEKHLFDATIRINNIRESLILLGVAERTSRVATVFPPLLATWAIILLVSLIFAILGSMGIIDIGLYFPILIMLLYLILVSLVSLVIGSANIITSIARGLETGYEMAVAQLAGESSQRKTSENTE